MQPSCKGRPDAEGPQRGRRQTWRRKPHTRDHLYTRHPLDADRLDWSSEADIAFAVAQVTKPGLNTIKLS